MDDIKKQLQDESEQLNIIENNKLTPNKQNKSPELKRLNTKLLNNSDLIITDKDINEKNKYMLLNFIYRFIDPLKLYKVNRSVEYINTLANYYEDKDDKFRRLFIDVILKNISNSNICYLSL